MKTIVGFCFTEQPLKYLVEIGFLFQRSDRYIDQGYREFLCCLSEDAGTGHSLEVREILDEEAYLRSQSHKNFSPFESENSSSFKPVQHPNLVRNVQEILRADMEESDLKKILSVRKVHPLWALWLQSENLELFRQRAQSKTLISWRGQPAVLIPLGESCFDLIVS